MWRVYAEAEIRVMHEPETSCNNDPETDGEGKEEDKEDEEAVTDRPDPNLEDASEAFAVLNRGFFLNCCINENV